MTKSKDWLDENATGESFDPFTFENIGDAARGIIMDVPRVGDTQFGERLIVNLKTPEGPRTLWVKPGSMAQAVRDAVKAAGTAEMAEGGELAIAYTGERDTGKGNPMKLYTAKYKPPVGALNVEGNAAGNIFADM